MVLGITDPAREHPVSATRLTWKVGLALALSIIIGNHF